MGFHAEMCLLRVNETPNRSDRASTLTARFTIKPLSVRFSPQHASSRLFLMSFSTPWTGFYANITSVHGNIALNVTWWFGPKWRHPSWRFKFYNIKPNAWPANSAKECRISFSIVPKHSFWCLMPILKYLANPPKHYKNSRQTASNGKA